MASYAAPTDFFVRYDWRVVGDLVSDSSENRSENDMLTNPQLLAALADASGDIEAALMVGERYTIAQLQALTGNSLNLLVRVTCEIGLTYLHERKIPLTKDQLETLKEYRQLKDRHLGKLADGEDVFNITTALGAQTPSVQGLSTVQYETLNGLRDVCGPEGGGHYYPARNLPVGRGGGF